ncbi:MAG: helix-turn-helix domain-containing protein [Bacteriovoracaceae bacterium]|nr:helix-turn-helix domain-containing protein [Bacteriovoracaceae bacterium]
MSEMKASELMGTLKKVLKAKKLTYKALGEKLSFSEGTLKNIFHHNNISIERLFEICEVAEINFQDLIRMSSRAKEDEFSFSLNQEEFFADHPEYYFFFREVFFQRKSLKQLEREFSLSEKSVLKYILTLEKLGLCDVLPGNNLRWNVNGKLRWIKNGPWNKKHLKSYVQRTLSLIQENRENCYNSQIGHFSISQKTYEDFKEELRRLEDKYREIAFQDHMMNRKGNFIPVSYNFSVIDDDIFDIMTEIPNL